MKYIAIVDTGVKDANETATRLLETINNAEPGDIIEVHWTERQMLDNGTIQLLPIEEPSE